MTTSRKMPVSVEKFRSAIPTLENLIMNQCWKIVLLSLTATFSSVSNAEETSPSPIIFYLHGQIVEELGPRPVHDRWGLYDYPAVVDALGSTGAKVISEVRDRGTDAVQYANKVVKEIRGLISEGVSPERIVVVGFSKGGGIAIFISDRLNHLDVRFVLLAACNDWLSSVPDVQLSGHVLSLVEESDILGRSCSDLASRNEDLASFEEIEISTGKEHGTFYLPRPDWLRPVLEWINRDARRE